MDLSLLCEALAHSLQCNDVQQVLQNLEWSDFRPPSMYISNIIFTLKILFGCREKFKMSNHEHILYIVHVCGLIFLSIPQAIAPPNSIPFLIHCATNLTKGYGLRYEEGIIHSNPIHFHP
jgi:hypothetical protein